MSGPTPQTAITLGVAAVCLVVIAVATRVGGDPAAPGGAPVVLVPQPEPAEPLADHGDAKRMCAAVRQDGLVGSLELTAEGRAVADGRRTASESAERIGRVVDDIRSRTTAYPGATQALKDKVSALADRYAITATKIGDPTAYAAEVAATRAAQARLLDIDCPRT